MANLNLLVPQHTGTEDPAQVFSDVKTDMASLETSNNDIESRQAVVDSLAPQVIADATKVAADLSITGANRIATAADRVITAGDRVAAEAARVAAEAAAATAAAVVTGGTATVAPSAGKIPIADAKGHISAGWLGITAEVALAGMDGVTVAHNLGSLSYMVKISPMGLDGKDVGAITYIRAANSVTIYNTGEGSQYHQFITATLEISLL